MTPEGMIYTELHSSMDFHCYRQHAISAADPTANHDAGTPTAYANDGHATKSRQRQHTTSTNATTIANDGLKI